MNKIYKLCEYGISLYTVQRLINNKITIEDLMYNIDNINLPGFGNKTKNDIRIIINNPQFDNENSSSIFELCNVKGFKLYHIKELFDKGITLEDILNGDFEKYNISVQLKNKIKAQIDEIQELYFSSNEQNDVDYSGVLYNEIKNIIHPFDVISINRLKNELIIRNKYPINHYLDDINLLIKSEKISCGTEGITIVINPLKKEVEMIEDSRFREVFELKLSGKTLEEIGEKFDLTRQRVEQMIKKVLKTLPVVVEDKYKDVFSFYNWNMPLFTDFYCETEYAYNYICLRYKKGQRDVENLYFDFEIDDRKRRVLDKHLNYIEVYNEKVKNNSDSLIKVFLKNEAEETIPIQILYEKYKEFAKKYNTFCYKSETLFLNAIGRKEYMLNINNQNVRYYDVNSFDKIEQLVSILNCSPGEYSTYYFYSNYNDIMQLFDIRNEYELHNLYRIIDVTQYNDKVLLERMPNLLIGFKDKKAFFDEELMKISPIDIENAGKYFCEEFGHREDTCVSFLRGNYSEYINDNIISFDVEELSDELSAIICNRIKDDFCTISNAKEIFEMIIGKDYSKYFNSLNLNKMGYKIRGDYIQKTTIVNIEMFIYEKLKDKKTFYIDEIPYYSINGVSNAVRNIENRFDIIRFHKDEYINYWVLKNGGIDKKDLIEYGKRAQNEYMPGEFFTLYSLRNRLGLCQLDNEGFDDCFYESILTHTDGIKKISFDRNNVYYISSTKDRHEYSSKDFIYDLISAKDVISYDEIITILEDEYDIKINNKFFIISRVTANKYYYDVVLDKFYANKMLYYDEIYGGMNNEEEST